MRLARGAFLLAVGLASGLGTISASLGAPDGRRSSVEAAERSRRAAPAPARDEELGARAQRETQARQLDWDRKMKAATGGICTGC